MLLFVECHVLCADECSIWIYVCSLRRISASLHFLWIGQNLLTVDHLSLLSLIQLLVLLDQLKSVNQGDVVGNQWLLLLKPLLMRARMYQLISLGGEVA